MTSVYSGGVHATAITAITAAVNSRIVTNADGTKSLDMASLSAWLRGQYDSMVADAEATSVGYIASIDVNALVTALNAKLRKETLQQRTDYPNSNLLLTQTSVAAAVKDKLAELKSLSDDVTLIYKGIGDKVYDAVNTYLDSEGIVTGLPAGVELFEHDRAYIVCYATDRGELSKPSAASAVVTMDQNDTASVTVPAAPGGRNITHFRPFRATSGNASAAYLYVPHPTDANGWPIGTLTFTDDLMDTELQEPCPSLTWDEPPADLRGLTAGSNGAMAGFTGNTFVPCVNFRPYAFPQSMRRTTEDPIVGLGHFDNTWVVCTRGVPYFATGSDVQLLDFEPKGGHEACLSIDSIVSMDGAVLYASPSGLQMASAGGVKNITDEGGFNLFTPTQWLALNPASILAAEWQGHYLFTYNNGTPGAYILNLHDGSLGTLDLTSVTAFYRDLNSGTLYGAIGTTIKSLFTAGTNRTARWRGKMAEMDGTGKFAFARVKDGQNKTLEAAVTVRMFDGPTQVDSKSITTVKAVRVKGDRIADLSVEVESAGRVSRVTLAGSARDLQ